VIPLTADWPFLARVGIAFIVALIAFPAAGLAASMVRNAARKSAKLKVVDRTVVTFGAELVRVGFLIAALILVLTLAGVESTSVAAVLGAATLAIGLALQATLANVAAGVLIFIFAPYRVGEFVEIAGKQGQVKLLSMFTTELESAQGLSIVLANAQVMTQPVTNFTRNSNRRVDVDVTLDWDSDTDIAIAVACAAIANDPRLSDGPKPNAIIKSLTDKGPILSVRMWTNPQESADLSFDAAAKIHTALRKAGIKGAQAGA
jgi:small conductance mechanosensitive channel